MIAFVKQNPFLAVETVDNEKACILLVKESSLWYTIP